MYYKSAKLRNGRVNIGDYIEVQVYGKWEVLKLIRIRKGDYHGMFLFCENGYTYSSDWCRKLDVTDARVLLKINPL